jgi:hypothetical protein
MNYIMLLGFTALLGACNATTVSQLETANTTIASPGSVSSTNVPGVTVPENGVKKSGKTQASRSYEVIDTQNPKVTWSLQAR